ncbi:MAG TPA: hypothetical protein VF588_14195 [Pyrinomonadaceae bacterium]
MDPLDPRDLQKAVRGKDFAQALTRLEQQATAADVEQTGGTRNATRSALEQIAGEADLSSDEDATRAVRESARFLIHSRIGPEHGESEQGASLVEGLAEYASNDPFLKTKLLNILKRLKAG